MKKTEFLSVSEFNILGITALPFKLMKHVIVPILLLTAAASLLFAQGIFFSGTGKPYDPKEGPPRLALPQAYRMAVAHIGTATNRFYCVSASCLEKTLPVAAGWVFWFSNTNGERARVEVYFRSKVAYIPDAKSAALLK